jgi:hypothetical protein
MLSHAGLLLLAHQIDSEFDVVIDQLVAEFFHVKKLG